MVCTYGVGANAVRPRNYVMALWWKTADFHPREIRLYGNDSLFSQKDGKYEGLIMVKILYCADASGSVGVSPAACRENIYLPSSETWITLSSTSDAAGNMRG